MSCRFQLFDVAFGHVAVVATGFVGTIEQIFDDAVGEGQDENNDQEAHTDIDKIVKL